MKKETIWTLFGLYSAKKILNGKCQGLAILYVFSMLLAAMFCSIYNLAKRKVTTKNNTIEQLAKTNYNSNELNISSPNTTQLTSIKTIPKDETPPQLNQEIKIDEDTLIIIDHSEYCPDETVFFRIAQHNKCSSLYKRMIYQKNNEKYFVLNNKKYVIDQEKIKPTIKNSI